MARKTAIHKYLSVLGRKGGSSKSEAKAAASRANGLKHKPKPDHEVSQAALAQRRYRAARRAVQPVEHKIIERTDFS